MRHLCDGRFGSIKPSNTTAPAKSSKKEDKTMMNTMTNNKLNMDELAAVNGGGFFDFISKVVDLTMEFVAETAENMKVPAMSVTEFIGEGICDKVSEFTENVLRQLKG